MEKPAFTEASSVTVVEGDVVVIGPGCIGASLTPQAAEETGRRLAAAAAKALDEPPPYEPE